MDAATILLGLLAEQHTEGLTLTIILYWFSVWAIAFAAGAIRTLSRRRDRDLCDVLIVGGHSGFSGFAIAGVLDWSLGSPGGHGTLYLATATVVGLAGLNQDQLLSWAIRTITGLATQHSSKPPRP